MIGPAVSRLAQSSIGRIDLHEGIVEAQALARQRIPGLVNAFLGEENSVPPDAPLLHGLEPVQLLASRHDLDDACGQGLMNFRVNPD